LYQTTVNHSHLLYSFEHVTSSPNYPQSNGKAENAVKTAKNLLEKALKSNQDPYLALLDWRNTPTETVNTCTSPVQRLFSRRTKMLLPTSNRLLKATVPEDIGQKMKLQKAKQSIYYNKGAKELEELRPGDIVRIQPRKSQMGKSRDWTQARVEGKVDIRSYRIRTEDGRVYRRNRRHLKHTREVMPTSESTMAYLPRPVIAPGTSNPDEDKTSIQPAVITSEQQDTIPLTGPSTPNKQETPSALTKTRSGRVVRPPARFIDDEH